MHLAAATRTPMVVLFADAELESQWKPNGVPARLLRRETTYGPCFLFECPTNQEYLHIQPEETVQAVIEILHPSSEVSHAPPGRHQSTKSDPKRYPCVRTPITHVSGLHTRRMGEGQGEGTLVQGILRWYD